MAPQPHVELTTGETNFILEPMGCGENFDCPVYPGPRCAYKQIFSEKEYYRCAGTWLCSTSKNLCTLLEPSQSRGHL